MGVKLSTGLRNAMLEGGSFKEAFASASNGAGVADNQSSRIMIYSGTVPDTADAAPTGTLICTIHSASDGGAYDLGFNAAVAGIIAKKTGITWSGTSTASSASAPASYFRMVRRTVADGSYPAETGANNTTEIRLQGDIATAGAVLNFANTTFANSTLQTIDYFSVSLPAS